jgi:hypothetical protein
MAKAVKKDPAKAAPKAASITNDNMNDRSAATNASVAALSSATSSKLSPSLLSRIKRFTIVFVVSTAVAYVVSKRLQIPLSIMLW